MRFPAVFAVVVWFVLIAAAVAGFYSGASAVELAQVDGDILPGCQIPKSYGRLITVVAGNNTGIAGQAVFEDPEGTVRWVPFMFHSSIVRMPKPAKETMPAVFPVMPLYECTLGNVWKRH